MLSSQQRKSVQNVRKMWKVRISNCANLYRNQNHQQRLSEFHVVDILIVYLLKMLLIH